MHIFVQLCKANACFEVIFVHYLGFNMSWRIKPLVSKYIMICNRLLTWTMNRIYKQQNLLHWKFYRISSDIKDWINLQDIFQFSKLYPSFDPNQSLDSIAKLCNSKVWNSRDWQRNDLSSSPYSLELLSSLMMLKKCIKCVANITYLQRYSQWITT